MSDPASAADDRRLIARLASKARAHLAAHKTEKARADALEAKAAKLAADLDAAVAKASDSTASRRVDELTAELRSVRHRAAFDKLADAAGVKPGAARDDLWNASGWKPETDLPDEAALKAAVESQRDARPYLFADAAVVADPTGSAPNPSPTTPVEPRPGPATGRGGNVAAVPTFTDEQLSDPRFAMLNFDAIAAAAAQRRDSGAV